MQNRSQRRKITIRVRIDAYLDELTFAQLHRETRKRFWKAIYNNQGHGIPLEKYVDKAMATAVYWLCRRYTIEIDDKGFNYRQLLDQRDEDVVLIFDRIQPGIMGRGSTKRDHEDLKFQPL